MTCGKTREFLASNNVTVSTEVNAKKQAYSESDARSLLNGIDLIISAKGKKVVTLSLKNPKLSWKEIAPLILGPTGNMRAPVVRKGKTLLVGFETATYQRLLN